MMQVQTVAKVTRNADKANLTEKVHAEVDDIICAGKIQRLQSFKLSEARVTADSLLEGLTTSTTCHRCGERRPSIKSPLSHWKECQLWQRQGETWHKTRFWGFP